MLEIAAVVLAAGRGTRFGAKENESKVAAEVGGTPMVRRVVDVALASRAAPVIVVTGHAAPRVEAALIGLDVTIVRNADPAGGMAGSLRIGIAAVPAGCAGALVLLADMPWVAVATLDGMVDRFSEVSEGTDAVVPVHAGQAGNPVLLSRALFADIERLDGDRGARALLARPDVRVLLYQTEDSGVAVDIDTRAALDRRDD